MPPKYGAVFPVASLLDAGHVRAPDLSANVAVLKYRVAEAEQHAQLHCCRQSAIIDHELPFMNAKYNAVACCGSVQTQTANLQGTLGIRRFSADLSLCSVDAPSFCRAGIVFEPVFLHAKIMLSTHRVQRQKI